MAIIPIEIIPSAGLHNDGSSALDDSLGSFREVTNFRYISTGKFRQMPSFYPSLTWTPATYWNRDTTSSATEGTDSIPSLLCNVLGSGIFSASAYTARINSTPLKVVKQITVPTASIPISVNKGILATFGDYSDLTLGQTLDVVITATGTFKWRINGGSYTTGVAIATSVVITGNITLFFLALTGFTINDTFSWQRTDALSNSGSYFSSNYNSSYELFNDINPLIYFVGADSQVMLYDGFGVRSVGYRPVYGMCLKIYEGHLIVGSYSDAFGYSINNVVGNSDLNDFDNFISTDTNEADTFTIPATTESSNIGAYPGVTSLFVRNGVLFADTFAARWATSYLGLPDVFSFKEYAPLSYDVTTYPGFTNRVLTPDGVYYIQTDGIYFFDGANRNKVSISLNGLFQGVVELGNPFHCEYFKYGVYNPTLKEVWFYSAFDIYQNGPCFFIYQEETGIWFTRAAGFIDIPRAIYFYQGRTFISKYVGILTEDHSNSQSTIVKDSVSGTVFQVPTIISQDISIPSIQKVKENESCYLDAYYPTALASAYANTGMKVEVSGRTYADQDVNFVSTPTPPIWVRAAQNGIISLRVPGARVYRFRFTALSGNSAKAPFGFTFNRFVMNVYGTDTPEVRK